MSSVQVYIYDLSQGLAKAMSYQLIGQHLDGIWHTGIVVYGKEFFFGSGGIDMCPPGGTVLGRPHRVADLGRTEVPEDLFMAYLTELSENAFKPEKYHLFDHNCNTFSDEVAHFLTNRHVPEYVTNLPATVSSTPLGKMMRSFMDSMNPSSGGSSLFGVHPGSSGCASETAPSSSAPPRKGSPQGRSNPPPKTSVPKQSPASPRRAPSPKKPPSTSSNNSSSPCAQKVPSPAPSGPSDVELCEAEISHESFQHWRTIASDAKSSLRDLYEFATASAELNWGLGPKHFALVGKQLKQEPLPDQLLILALFRTALSRSADVAMGLVNDRSRSWVQLLSEDNSDASAEFKIGLLQVACNCVAQLGLIGRALPESCRTPLVDLVLEAMDGPADVQAAATQLGYNLTCVQAVQDDAVLSLGSIVIHVLSEQREAMSETTQRFATKTLLQLCHLNDDIRQLAIVQGVDAAIIPGADGERLQSALQDDM